MQLQIYLLIFTLLVPSSYSSSQTDVQEEEVLRNIVFMRTEGLSMVELFHKNSKRKDIQTLCLRLKNYYKQTQPTLLAICQGKDLQLTNQELETILQLVKESELRITAEKEQLYLDSCEEHIDRSIQLYSMIIKDRNWANISYFSFQALPELFNIKKDLRRIKQSEGFQ